MTGKRLARQETLPCGLSLKSPTLHRLHSNLGSVFLGVGGGVAWWVVNRHQHVYLVGKSWASSTSSYCWIPSFQLLVS